MEADMQSRQSEITREIRRLEGALAQSPDDAFGYLELGCLFAEADQREAALEAFRQSYAHRTGGIALSASDLPVVDEQLKEAFEVAVAAAPARSRGQTRELFDLAVTQAQQTAKPIIARGIIGAGLLVIMALAAFTGPMSTPETSGYWPPDAAQPKLQHLPPANGYWVPQIR